MYTGTMVRYVLGELLKVFVVTITGLTVVLVLVTVAQEAIRQGIGLLVVARLIPYAVPNALVFTLPATVLFSACAVFGRMSADNEIVAFESLGISPVISVVPALIAAFLVSVLTVWVIDIAFSWGYAGMQRVVCKSIDQIVYGVLHSTRSYSTEQFSIAVASVDGRRLLGPAIRFQRDDGESVAVTAREAQLHVDAAEEELWISLTEGVVELGGGVEFVFHDTIEQRLPLRPHSARGAHTHPSHMRLWQIGAAPAKHEDRVTQFERALAVETAFLMLTGSFEGRPGGRAAHLVEELKSERLMVQRLKTEPYRRWASGFSCLAFAFVGVPMAIRLKTADFVATFGICFLPILLFYYPLFMFGLDRAKVGALSTCLCVARQPFVRRDRDVVVPAIFSALEESWQIMLTRSESMLKGKKPPQPCETRTPHVGPSITLVLPACNEQESLAQSIREADEALQELTPDCEIIVVDDGSMDGTAAVALDQARQRLHVRLLRQPTNLGYGAALRLGFSAATKELVAFTDADAQFDMREMPRLVLLAKDYDIVCGYRIDRQDAWYRKMWSYAYNFLVQLLFSTRVRDIDCAFKMFRRETVKALIPRENGFFVNAELLARARMEGMSIVEVGVTHRPRLRGESTVSCFHSIPVFASMLRFYWNTSLFPAAAALDAHEDGWGNSWMEAGRFAVLCLLGCLMFLFNLSYPLIEPDETRYAQIALEMCQSGDWLTPTLDGRPYLDKPPLLYWLTASTYRAFGASPTTARLPGAICAVATVLAVFVLGRRLVGRRAAWCGSMALMLSGGFVVSGRFVITDGPLTLFTTLTLLAAYPALRGPRVHLGWLLAAGLACGLGILTKGPIAVFLCVPPLVAVHWLSRDLAPMRCRHWLALLGPAACVAAPWFVVAATTHDGFAAHFFWKHHLVRFVDAFDHRAPCWYYFPVILAGMFPASALLLPLAPFMFDRSRSLRRRRCPEMGFLLLSAAWIICFFSLSSCKLATYVLPAVPPLCLLMGSMLDRVALLPEGEGQLQTLLNPIPRRLGIALLVIALAALIIKYALEAPTSYLLDVIVVAAVGLLLVAVCRTPSRRVHWRWAVSMALALLVTSYVLASCLPVVARQRSIQLAATSLQQQHGIPVVYFAHEAHGTSLQKGPPEPTKFRAEQVEEFVHYVNCQREVVLVTSPGSVDQLKDALGTSCTVIPAGGRQRVYFVQSQLPQGEVGVHVGQNSQGIDGLPPSGVTGTAVHLQPSPVQR